MATKSYMKVFFANQTSPGLELTSKKYLPYLTSVSLKDSLESLDSVQMSVEIPSGPFSSLYKDFDVCGKQWIVELYENGSLVKKFAGDIMSVSWARSAGSSHTCTITGVSHLHRLKRPRTTSKAGDRRFRDKAASDIVKQIATDWQLSTDKIEATSGKAKDEEWKSDDAALLKKLAQENNYVLRTNFDGSHHLVFSRREDFPTGKVELIFGRHVLDIQSTQNLDGQITQVDVDAHDPKKPDEKVASSVTKSAVKAVNDTVGPEYMERISKFPVHLENRDGSKPTQSSAKDQAEGMLKDAAAKFLEGTMTCGFQPSIGVDKKVVVKGAGWPLDGTFLVKEVTHTYDPSGYRTSVSFSANSIKKP